MYFRPGGGRGIFFVGRALAGIATDPDGVPAWGSNDGLYSGPPGTERGPRGRSRP